MGKTKVAVTDAWWEVIPAASMAVRLVDELGTMKVVSTAAERAAW